MDNILDTMKKMGKATAREIAVKMKIEPITALDMLREHEDREEVDQSNGYRQIPTLQAKTKAPDVPGEVSLGDLLALLEKHGPRTAIQLSKLTGFGEGRVRLILAEVVKEIPDSLTPKATSEISGTTTNTVAVPALGAIAKEIRSMRAKLTKLEKLRAAVRELNKHKSLMAINTTSQKRA